MGIKKSRIKTRLSSAAEAESRVVPGGSAQRRRGKHNAASGIARARCWTNTSPRKGATRDSRVYTRSTRDRGKAAAGRVARNAATGLDVICGDRAPVPCGPGPAPPLPPPSTPSPPLAAAAGDVTTGAAAVWRRETRHVMAGARGSAKVVSPLARVHVVSDGRGARVRDRTR